MKMIFAKKNHRVGTGSERPRSAASTAHAQKARRGAPHQRFLAGIVQCGLVIAADARIAAVS
jgi:hypothetical protein